MSQNLQSTLPKFDVFANPPQQTMPLIGRPPKQGAAGVGLSTTAVISPAAALVQTMRQVRRPMGQVGGGLFAQDLVGLALLGVAAVASYQAGKAMAPSGKETMWAWIGVPTGLLTGTLGLGVMGYVASRKS